MASEEARDWRTGLSLQERQRYMYEGKYATDVTLMLGKVNPEKIAAHRFVLVCGSPVFEAMLTEGRDGDIVLEEVEPEVFDAVLRFLYCEQIELKVDTAMDVLHAARKYDVSQLVIKCTDYLMGTIDVHNVCLYLNKSVQYNEKELFEGFMDYLFSCDTKLVFDSTEFTRLSHQSLKKVLESDLTYGVSPRGVYAACMRWADSQCTVEAKDITEENRRAVLGSCLYLIRFPDMLMKEFTKVTQESKLLADDERLQIMEFIAHREHGYEYMGPMVFNEAKCKPGEEYQIRRYTGFENQTGELPGTSAIDFQCSKSVWITGVSLYVGNYREDNEVAVKLMDDDGELLAGTGNVVMKHKSDITRQNSHLPVDVHFPKSVPIRQNQFYQTSAKYKCKQFRCGTEGQETVENGGVTFTFRQTPGSTTTVNQGQIPAIIFAT